ncbi:MAG: hypothetical protein O7G31_14315 [Calditrichaeota bacterium]|nr:hypothetical protein [Calditrichota bacterium]
MTSRRTTKRLRSGRKVRKIGLCESCEFARGVVNARGSEFYFCEYSKVDTRFTKYPALPVLACTAYREHTDSDDK